MGSYSEPTNLLIDDDILDADENELSRATHIDYGDGKSRAVPLHSIYHENENGNIDDSGTLSFGRGVVRGFETLGLHA